jgi:hypothetical protein
VSARHRFAPHLLLLALTLAAFAAASLVPYRIDTDTALQLESVRQWRHGSVPAPGYLSLPDPRDLSRDTLLWTNWFPPAFPFLYAPLAAAGLPFAATLRLTSLLLFLLGSLGWLRLADRLDPPLPVRLLFALSLTGYALTLGGAASLRTADVVSYAAAPWLVALALACGAKPWRTSLLGLCGLALGATYWLRYSLFLTALPLLAWVAFQTVRGAREAGGHRGGRLLVLGLAFALPIAALFAFNVRHADSLAATVTGTRTAWVIGDKTPVRPLRLAAGLAGSPGLGLFQDDLWIHHLVNFSDARLPFLRRMGGAGRILLKSLLGIPGTAALAWGLARGLRRLSGPLPALAVAVPAGFYLALTAVSFLVGYNYLINEVRFAAGVLPLAHPIVLAGWLGRDGDGRRSIPGVLLLLVLFVPPLLFAAAVFLKNDLRDRLRPPYTATATGLFTPELSRRDAAAVQAAVAAAAESPRDVVVLAGPRGWGSSFVLWPEIDRRVFPVSTYVAPLGARFQDAASLDGRVPLTTSRALRVVLVVAQSLTTDGSLAALEARFPQAGPWRGVPVPPGAAVAVLSSTLEVHP